MTTILDHFQSDGIEIAYRIDRPLKITSGTGEKYPVLLIHGFVSNGETNWVSPSWTTTLVKAGYETICIDNRGPWETVKSSMTLSVTAPL